MAELHTYTYLHLRNFYNFSSIRAYSHQKTPVAQPLCSAVALASQLALLNAFFTSTATTAHYRLALFFCFKAFFACDTTFRIASTVEFRRPNCLLDSPLCTLP